MPTICPPYLRLSVESATATAKVVSTLVQLQDCQDAGHEARRSPGGDVGTISMGGVTAVTEGRLYFTTRSFLPMRQIACC